MTAVPLLSIVIANYNYGRFLGEAIQSVLSQIGNGKDQVRLGEVELIVIDGGSTDNSVDVIRKYAGGEVVVGSRSRTVESPISYWVSEPDKGQSNAFNKGFAKARGRFLTWLNADDVMIDGAIARLAEAVRRNPGRQWFAGGSVHFGPDEKVILCTNTRRFSNYEAAHGQIVVYAPSSFFSRDLFNKVGGFDEFFRYSMDTHLWARFFTQEHVRYMKLPGYMFGFRYHAGSKTTCVHFKNERAKSDAEDHRDNEQGKVEHERICALFPPYKPMRNWVRLLRMDWCAKAESMIDTWRYRGRSLVDCGFIKEG